MWPREKRNKLEMILCGQERERRQRIKDNSFVWWIICLCQREREREKKSGTKWVQEELVSWTQFWYCKGNLTGGDQKTLEVRSKYITRLDSTFKWNNSLNIFLKLHNFRGPTSLYLFWITVSATVHLCTYIVYESPCGSYIVMSKAQLPRCNGIALVQYCNCKIILNKQRV